MTKQSVENCFAQCKYTEPIGYIRSNGSSSESHDFEQQFVNAGSLVLTHELHKSKMLIIGEAIREVGKVRECLDRKFLYFPLNFFS